MTDVATVPQIDRISEVQAAELDLARGLRLLSAHHAANDGVHEMSRTLARQSTQRLGRLRPFLVRQHAHPAGPDGDALAGTAVSVRRHAAHLTDRDLRDVYLRAQRTEIDWAVLMQSAEALGDHELLEVVRGCHAQVEATAAWLRTRIKVGCAQALVP